MKKSLLLMLICALTSYSGIFAQDLPSPVAEGFAFPLGLKYTIKLFPADSGKFNYSVIEAEEFSEIVEMFDDSLLFSEEGSDSTISLIFCLGTHGETDQERNENMNVLLIMKNYTRYELEYTSDIKRSEEGDFEPTSNIGLIPGALSTEMWPYKILAIGLSDFKIPPGLE